MSTTTTASVTSVLDVPVTRVVGQQALFPGLDTPAHHAKSALETRRASLNAQISRIAEIFTRNSSITGVRAEVRLDHTDTKPVVFLRGRQDQFKDTYDVACFLSRQVLPVLSDVEATIFCVVDYDRGGAYDSAYGEYTAGATYEQFMDSMMW